MIRLNLMAGMGNQMFEYAYARALSLEFNEKLYLNPYFMTMAGFGAGRKCYFNNVLEKLNIPKEVVKVTRVSGIMSGVSDMLFFLVLRRYRQGKFLHGETSFEKMNKIGKYYSDDCFTYFDSKYTQCKNKKIIGYFQSEKYFEKYRDIIRKEMKVIVKPSKENQLMLEQIDADNAVCVHIRRGDYISNNKNASLVVCDESYYRCAMKYIAERISKPVFYVFSDNSKEIEWIKSNYEFEYPVKYVALDNPDYEEIRLMYHCKHFVIANSTFSWWGAYLSDSEEKIVIAPKMWNKTYQGKIDVYLESMILM